MLDIFKAIVAKVVIQSSRPGALSNPSNGVKYGHAFLLFNKQRY